MIKLEPLFKVIPPGLKKMYFKPVISTVKQSAQKTASNRFLFDCNHVPDAVKIIKFILFHVKGDKNVISKIIARKHRKKTDIKTENFDNKTIQLSKQTLAMIKEGKLTEQEAVLFSKIQNLEGEEFITTAYDLIAKNMELPKYPKLLIDNKYNSPDLAQSGENIIINVKSFERKYDNNQKEELINSIRHEIEHFKQDLIIIKEKGEEEYKEAFIAGKCYRMGDKARIRCLDECCKTGQTRLCDYIDRHIDLVFDEEGSRVGFISTENIDDDIILDRIFEHETPIKTIRSMTEDDWKNLHFTKAELTKAGSYLHATRFYKSTDCFPQEYFLPDGNFDLNKIQRNRFALDVYNTFFGKGYVNNPSELDARKAGEALKYKFKLFTDTFNSNIQSS